MLVYDYFAKAYHWTPAQVDELSLDHVFWLPVLDQARNAAIEQLQDK